MRNLVLPAAALVAALASVPALGGGGALDPTFGTGGVATGGFGSISSLALQSDGRILGTGYCNNIFCVERYTVAGALDASFGAGGRVTTDMGPDIDNPYGVVVQPGGRIVAGGECDLPPYYATDFCLAGYDSAGNLDGTFGVGGKVFTDFALQSDPTEAFDRITGLAVQTDGKVVGAGWCQGGSSTTAYYAFCVARYLPDGTLDATFGGGKVHTSFTSPPNDDEGSAVAIDGLGNVIVVGTCHLGLQIDFCIARYDANGIPDAAFGVGGQVTTDFAGKGDQATAVAVQADNRIVVAGYCYAFNPAFNTYTGNFCLARYNTNGSLDATFGTGGKVVTITNLSNAGAYGLAIQPLDGKLVVAGVCYPSGSSHGQYCVARYNADGTPDATFGTGGIVVNDISGTGDVAFAVALQPDGKILVGGNCAGHFCVARYLPVAVDNPPTDIALSASALAENLPVGTAIGTLSTVDPDPADTFTYALVAGAGSTDNGAFTISGNTLTSNAVFDFETQSSYSIRVRSTDSGGLFVEKAFTITINDVNEMPVAVNDAATTSVNNSVVVDVLSNDSDPDGDPLTVTAVTAPSKGTAVITAGTTVTYTPKKNYTGPDSFTYTISDGRGGAATASVAITVVAGNAPPRAAADKATTAPGTPVVIAVLANDSDPDGDPLTIVAITQGANGTVGNNGDGTLTYTPLAGFKGRDTFTYTISDGRGGTSVGKVTVRVK